MMRVVFNDLRRGTYLALGDVVMIDSQRTRVNGHMTNVWFVYLNDGTVRSFPQRHYTIDRVEI